MYLINKRMTISVVEASRSADTRSCTLNTWAIPMRSTKLCICLDRCRLRTRSSRLGHLSNPLLLYLPSTQHIPPTPKFVHLAHYICPSVLFLTPPLYSIYVKQFKTFYRSMSCMLPIM